MTGGLSRGGKLLANVSGGPHNDYAGHVFWDMDTWIMPPIMMFYPDMARTMIDSRLRVLPAVKVRAKASGYEGAQFPWEQAFTGNQHRHITALTLLLPQTIYHSACSASFLFGLMFAFERLRNMSMEASIRLPDSRDCWRRTISTSLSCRLFHDTRSGTTGQWRDRPSSRNCAFLEEPGSEVYRGRLRYNRFLIFIVMILFNFFIVFTALMKVKTFKQLPL